MAKLIYLHASEVAAAIGAAFYKSPEDVRRAVRDREAGRAGEEDERMAALPAAQMVEAAAPEDRAPLRAAVARAVGTVERAHVARAVIQSAAASVTHPIVPTARVDAGEARVVERMTTLVPPAARPAVREAVRHVVSTERGIRAEPAIVDALEARTGAPVTDRNEAVRYLTVGGVVRVGGRTDGVDRANGVIVEAKHRRHGFLGVPEYEAVQCEVYMRMYRLPRCCLVEHADGESREHHLEASPERWARIQRGLGEFAAACRDPPQEASAADLRAAGF